MNIEHEVALLTVALCCNVAGAAEKLKKGLRRLGSPIPSEETDQIVELVASSGRLGIEFNVPKILRDLTGWDHMATITTLTSLRASGYLGGDRVKN